MEIQLWVSHGTTGIQKSGFPHFWCSAAPITMTFAQDCATTRSIQHVLVHTTRSIMIEKVRCGSVGHKRQPPIKEKPYPTVLYKQKRWAVPSQEKGKENIPLHQAPKNPSHFHSASLSWVSSSSSPVNLPATTITPPAHSEAAVRIPPATSVSH